MRSSGKAPDRRGEVRVGVAGWDYPDWDGIVYPHGTGIDRLRHLSRFVDVVEINTTFYRPIAPRVTTGWVRRVRDRRGFRFTAKVHRSWTHESAAVSPATVLPTLEGLGPMREAGALGALLVQFPQRFHAERAALDRLERLLDLAEGWPLVVEVRHASWDRPEARAVFRDRGVGWCVVDQPRLGSTLRPSPRVTSSIAYLRLHGRNAIDWFREGAGRDARYDYLYDPEELRPLAESVSGMAQEAAEVYVIQNNHFRGQALVNALQMRHLLEGVQPPAPEELVLAYPQLAGNVRTEQGRLF